MEYEYCIDTMINDSCDDFWVNVGGNTTASVEKLSLLTTYVWQVRAINAGGTVEADGGLRFDFVTSATQEDVFDDSFETGGN